MPGGLSLLALQLLGAAQATPVVTAGEPSPALAPAPAAIREEDLLLFALILDGSTLTESLAAYGAAEDPLLPVGELVRLLDLNVDASPSRQTITGNLGESQRSLAVDLRQGLARSGGKTIALSADQTAFTASEIYLKASILEQLLPLKLAIDPEALQVTVTATEKLPVQARIERERRISGLGPEAGPPDVPMMIETPYRLFTLPAFDVALDTGTDTRGNRFSRRYDLRAAGDLLYMGYQGFVGSDELGKADSARLTFERRSQEGRLLGPLGATYVGAGDVFTPSMAMGPRSVGGRGFSFSTAKLGEASVFQRITLRGELPNGYDVELYINDVLRSGQRSPVEGRYEFIDVPLVRGLNVVRIVTYGPRGERSEQTRVINVGGGQLAKGELSVDFGLVQQDRSLIEFHPRDSGLAKDLGELRAVAGFAYGLATEVTLVGGASLYPDITGERHEIFSVGARGSLFGMAVQGDAVRARAGGTALGVGLAGQILGISTVARHNEYSGGFVDETLRIYNPARPLARHSELTLDFTLPSFGEQSIPLSLRLEREGYGDGGESWLGIARGSTSISSVWVSGGLDYLRESQPGQESTERLGGNLAASTFLDFKWQLRGVIDYDILPDAELKALSITGNRQISDAISVQAGLGRTFGESKDLAVQGGVFFQLPFADVAVTGDYAAAKGDWRLGLRLAFGLGFDPSARRYRMLRPGPAGGGSALVHAFLDSNANGIFDAGESAVPGVGIEGGERKVATNSRGRAFVTGLGNSVGRRLQTNLNEIEQGYVTSPPSTIEFASRPGNIVKIDYPLAPVGDVVARVRMKRGEELVGLSALRVRLVQEGSEPITATTEYDGSVYFQQVKPGTYRFELDPEQAAALKMRLADEIRVRVSSDSSQEIDAEVFFEAQGAGSA